MITITAGSFEATKARGTYDIGPRCDTKYNYGVYGAVTIASDITIKDKNGNPAVIYEAPAE